MSAVLPAPAPRPMHWTVAKFHEVNATGAFAGRRPVLIRGVILEQGEMNPPHANAVILANEAIREVFGRGWVVRVQLPLVLGQDSDPFPDLAVVRGGPRDFPGHPTAADLVIEVSDSSLAFDLTEKAELYAAAGVPDYWVLDVIGRRLLVLRDPAPVAANGHAYRTQQTFGPAEAVSPLAVPAAGIPVADLLP
ncbi:MAG: Uma2 family endonuclease [Fimbriiglobus sp.]